MADQNPTAGGGDDLGATEREIIAQRARKAEALRALGVNPFGNGYRPEHRTADLVGRSFGKAAFLRVRDPAGEIQVWVKKDKLPERDFEVYKLLDVGDVVAAS